MDQHVKQPGYSIPASQPDPGEQVTPSTERATLLIRAGVIVFGLTVFLHPDVPLERQGEQGIEGL